MASAIAAVPCAPARRHVVVGDAERQIGPRDGQTRARDLGEGVMRAFVHEMAVDPQQRVAVLLREDDVGVPELVEQGACGGQVML